MIKGFTPKKSDIKLIEKSVAHWERLSEGIDEGVGADTCAFCKKYNSWGGAAVEEDCVGCPIAYVTGKAICEGTPYIDANFCYDEYGVNSKEFKRAAKKMTTFLKKLLP